MWFPISLLGPSQKRVKKKKITIIFFSLPLSGAQQAGDLMQDLKTGHLIGAAPRAQFWGQLIGSTFSIFFSVAAYKLYTSAYEIPSEKFPVPTAGV
jgi:uncharacterized oligopeptide transporter (OPT) family protein